MQGHKNLIIGWFSAGVTSTVACKLAIEKYGIENVELFYFDTGMVHPDNPRFIKECEEWYGKEIHICKNKKYENPIDVARKVRWVNGPGGARCTLELKKKVRYDIQGELKIWKHQVMGFEYSKKEILRAKRFEENFPETFPIFPLIENKIGKKRAIQIIQEAGIRIPVMYELGYNNNNCIGCFKGGAGYWNKIRQDFPEIFKETAKMEREVGGTCIKGKYLDKLSKKAGRHSSIYLSDCGSFCQIDIDKDK